MRLRLLVVLSALGCAAVLVACGGSSSSKSTTRVGYADGVKFADCIRAHGVPNFPDPVGGGFSFPVGAGFQPGAPAFKVAQQDCRSLMPHGGTGPPEASAHQKAQMLQLSTCMRAHGVTGFPDPVSSAPGGLAGYSIAFGSPGAFIAVPSTINVQSPTFRDAASACAFPGFGSHAR